jgi:hypothetical protein
MTEDTRAGDSDTQKPAQPATPKINFALLTELRFKPHPHIRDIPFPTGVHIGWAEIADEAKAAHHLLDLAGIANAQGYDGDLDARTWQLVVKAQQLDGIHDRLRTWHARETEGGMVGDYCVECGSRWPCDTIRLLDGEEVS